MKRKLLLAAMIVAGAIGGGSTLFAEGQDLTSSYITNPDFEGSYTEKIKPNNDTGRYVYEPEGWTIDRVIGSGSNNDISALKSGDKQWDMFKDLPKPTDGGEKTYWIRSMGTNPAKIFIKQTLNLKFAGKYRLTADAYKKIDSSSKSQAIITFGDASVTINQSETWDKYSVDLSIRGESNPVISCGLEQKDASQIRNIAAFDNFVLTYEENYTDELSSTISYAKQVNTKLNNSDLESAIGVAESVISDKTDKIEYQATIDNAVTALKTAISTAVLAHSFDAEGDDVTYLIANNGFEISPTYESTSTNPTEGSVAFSTGNNTAKDVFYINGWEFINTQPATDYYTYARTFTMPYNTTVNALGASLSIESPSNESSIKEGNNSLLFVQANWLPNSNLGVQQTVTLPAGTYTLTFDSYIQNVITNATSLCGVSYGTTTEYKWPGKAKEWTNNVIEFRLDESTEVTISMGYKKGKGNQDGNGGGPNESPFLFVDNVKLQYKSNNAAAIQEWETVHATLVELANGDTENALPDAIITLINKTTSPSELAEIEAETTLMNSIITDYDAIKAEYTNVIGKLNEVKEMDEEETYADELAKIEAGIENSTTAEDLAAYYPQLEKIWKDLDNATKSEYADLQEKIKEIEGKLILGFEEGEYAPYNNIEIVKALAEAKNINSEEYNSGEIVRGLIEALSAEPKVNTEAMNAVYNGDFKFSKPNTVSGKDVDVPGWTPIPTTDGPIRRVIQDKVEGADPYELPGLEETTSGKALMVWGSNDIAYGNIVGYTMPLAAHTIYELTFKHSGWGADSKGANNSFGVSVLNSDNKGMPIQQCGKSASGPGVSNCWNTFTMIFVTEEAGDYVLNMCPSGNSTFTDITLYKSELVFADNKDIPNYLPGTYPTVKIERTFSTDKWATAVYPFEISAEGVTVATLTSFDDNGMLHFSTNDGSKANEPALIKAKGSIELTNVDVEVAKAEDVANGGITFKGVYKTEKVNAGDGVINYVLSSNTLYPIGDTPATVTPYRAYFVLNTNDVDAKTRLSFVVDGEATGIDAIEVAEDAVENAVYYNLAGQRVQNPTKGIYIVNGKKVLVK